MRVHYTFAAVVEIQDVPQIFIAFRTLCYGSFGDRRVWNGIAALVSRVKQYSGTSTAPRRFWKTAYQAFSGPPRCHPENFPRVQRILPVEKSL
jgi:hypothetical protein